MLGLFYEDTRVVIRSRPRILVRSGQTASIEVGNEIPLITQTADSGTQTEGDTNFLQQVSYRKTGVQMDITPIVQASGRVDLEISQSLSEARPHRRHEPGRQPDHPQPKYHDQPDAT